MADLHIMRMCNAAIPAAASTVLLIVTDEKKMFKLSLNYVTGFLRCVPTSTVCTSIH